MTEEEAHAIVMSLTQDPDDWTPSPKRVWAMEETMRESRQRSAKRGGAFDPLDLQRDAERFAELSESAIT